MMDIVKMNVNVGVLQANPKTVMLLYVQADCSVINLMHVGCLQKAY
jgi:hypothetical protein